MKKLFEILVMNGFAKHEKQYVISRIVRNISFYTLIFTFAFFFTSVLLVQEITLLYLCPLFLLISISLFLLNAFYIIPWENHFEEKIFENIKKIV